jgi:hypothetical protein
MMIVSMNIQCSMHWMKIFIGKDFSVRIDAMDERFREENSSSSSIIPSGDFFPSESEEKFLFAENCSSMINRLFKHQIEDLPPHFPLKMISFLRSSI